MTCSTSASVAIDVSPGVVMARAPCAAPYSTARLRTQAREESVDQPRREGVATAHAVEDLEVLAARGLVQRAVGPAHGAPVVAGGGPRVAQGRGDDPQVREVADDPVDHPPEARGIQRGEVRVQALDLEPEGGREVLLVAQEHVDEAHQLAVDLARPRRAADPLPQRGPVVEVVADDRAVAAGGLHRLAGDRGGRVGQRRRRCRRCGTSARRPRRRRSRPSRRRPGRSCEAAVWPRSDTPSAARTPNPRSVKLRPLRTERPTPSYGTQRTRDRSTPPCRTRSSISRPTGLSANAVTTAVRIPKQRARPRATLYSPPPSQAGRCGSSRSGPRPGPAAA